jgi:hypothetical protein
VHPSAPTELRAFPSVPSRARQPHVNTNRLSAIIRQNASPYGFSRSRSRRAVDSDRRARLLYSTRPREPDAGRFRTGSPRWLAAATIAIGGGIWSMHFVGMLAFSLPGIEISYDPFLPLLSLVIPIVVAAAAFAVVGRRPQALLASGFAMGLGISGMHYTGMSAMRMAASIEYDTQWVLLSIVIAISASVVALWLAFRHRRRTRTLRRDRFGRVAPWRRPVGYLLSRAGRSNGPQLS